MLNREEFLRLSLRIFGTPVIGWTLVNGVCGGCGAARLEPLALRLFPLVIVSVCGWGDCKSEFGERPDALLPVLFAAEDVFTVNDLLLVKSFALF